MLDFEILNYIFVAIIFVVSITVHEYAHVAAANALGDPTGKMMGRLTLNPLKHIDPIGFILIFLVGFGWGNPAPYNPNYLKKPYRDELLIAMAGPAGSLLLGVVGIVILLVYTKIAGVPLDSNLTTDLVSLFWTQFSLTNFALVAFNMIPLPPLDGYRLIKVASHSLGAWLEDNVRWISIAFLVLVVFGPFKSVLGEYIWWVAKGLFGLFIIPLGLVFN